MTATINNWPKENKDILDWFDSQKDATYPELVNYFEGYRAVGYETSPLSLLSYRIQKRKAKIIDGILAIKVGISRPYFYMPAHRTVNPRFWDIAEYLSLASIKKIRVHGGYKGIFVNPKKVLRYWEEEETVYDTQDILCRLNSRYLSKGQKKILHRNERDIEVRPFTRKNAEDILVVKRHWQNNKPGENKAQVMNQEKPLLEVIIEHNLWEEVFGIVCYRQGLPCSYAVGVKQPGKPEYGISIIAKALNYSHIPGGGNSTSLFTSIANCRLARSLGVRWYNNGPWVTTRPSGLKEYKLRLSKPENSIIKRVYVLDFPCFNDLNDIF